jgi:response regulator RpfG family c-di-GMP phosphodiesterase
MTNVLLVDDEPDFVLVMEKLLKKRGYEVSKAINGDGALKMAKEADVLLLDVMMADKNGWEVSKNLKENPETKNIPIIILTAKAGNESRKASFDYGGADWFISKPFDFDLLFFILDMAIKRGGMREIEKEIKKAIEKDKESNRKGQEDEKSPKNDKSKIA